MTEAEIDKRKNELLSEIHADVTKKLFLDDDVKKFVHTTQKKFEDFLGKISSSKFYENFGNDEKSRYFITATFITKHIYATNHNLYMQLRDFFVNKHYKDLYDFYILTKYFDLQILIAFKAVFHDRIRNV